MGHCSRNFLCCGGFPLCSFAVGRGGARGDEPAQREHQVGLMRQRSRVRVPDGASIDRIATMVDLILLSLLARLPPKFSRSLSRSGKIDSVQVSCGLLLFVTDGRPAPLLARSRLEPLAVESIGALEQFVDETYTPFMAPGVHVRPQPCPVGATPQPSATRSTSPAPLIDQPRPSAERAHHLTHISPAFPFPPIPALSGAARGDEVGARCRRVWTLHTRSPPAHAGRAMTDSALLYGFLA